MQASLRSLLDILSEPKTQFVIPVFQRVYSWTKRQCDQLWDDMLKANDGSTMHFMGTFIYMPEGEFDGIRRISLIDGQQRLTTITLMLIALRDALRASGDEACLKEAERIDETYLHASSDACKLCLSSDDDPTLENLINGTALPDGIESSKFLRDNLEVFRSKLNADSDRKSVV